MNVLVLNCGSSSLKFKLIETDTQRIESSTDRVKAKGLFERIGSQTLINLWSEKGGKIKAAQPLKDHRSVIHYALTWLLSKEAQIDGIDSLTDIGAVGHRVVHGGEHFSKSARVDEKVIQSIEDCIDLAPLHNPANLTGIRLVEESLGSNVPQVAVFDTAFHTSMPEVSYVYALPYQYYRRYKVRRYGFHGTSHRYIAYRYRVIKEIPKEQVNIITLHLGNGCSACAIKSGQSVDTSMGMTPVEGLVMGTRCGDIDPAVLEYIADKEGLSLRDLDSVMNKHSGLLGLSGLTNDMRELLEERQDHNDRRASLAIAVFCHRVKKYIGAYLAELGGADAIVFSGGIGENASDIRAEILSGLQKLGIKLDETKNRSLASGSEGLISADDSPIEVFVIPTNEELLIARDTFRVVTQST